MKYGEEIIGKRIRLISMDNDPNPIESGSVGTIYHIGGGIINVRWDNGRTLGVVEGEDIYEILSSCGMNILVLLAFWFEWKKEKKNNSSYRS